MGSSAKTGKFFIRGSQERKRCTFLGPKHKSAIWDRTPPTYTSNLVYMCAGGFRGHKSSNRIELSQFVRVIVILPIWVFSALGGGAGGWGILGVISYSLYEFRNVQRQRIFKQNRIISISTGLIEFCCFGLPAALGRGQVGGGCQGHLGAWGVSPTHAHVHTCTHMHIHTCIHV